MPDFLSLLETHDRVYDLFISHQKALLDKDVARAREQLASFEKALLRHMRAEEALLLPLYEKWGPHVRAPVMLFQFEHRRMLAYLSEFQATVARMTETEGDPRRAIIDLLDAEVKFKHLSEHHDEREERFLYPALNLATSTEERERILRRCDEWKE